MFISRERLKDLLIKEYKYSNGLTEKEDIDKIVENIIDNDEYGKEIRIIK
jgi:hypothetical protein